MLRVKLTALFFVFAVFSFGQSFSINGQVVDSLSEPISYASLSLANPVDTATITFIITKEDGSFRLNGIKPETYLLVTARMGYEVNYLPLQMNADMPNLKVVMRTSTKTFREVLVSAAKIPMMVNGDTVVYNANSFATQANDDVEDLIRRLPGIKVKRDGTIQSEGQVISRVLINGKEFFGGNIEAATKNLDANLVEKLEVIDRKTAEDEFAETSDAQREKVINLVLKDDKTQGYFGRIGAGYGTDNFYRGDGNINLFSGTTQFSLIGGTNNINRQLYGWEAMQTLNTFEISPFNFGNNQSWWFGGGVKTSAGVGANLHLDPSEDLQVDVSYIVGTEDNLYESERNAEVYLTNSTLFGETVERNVGLTQNHQINAKIEYEPDTLNRIVVRAQASTNAMNGLNLSQTLNSSQMESVLNSGVNKDDLEANTSKFATKVHYTRKNKKRQGSHFLGSLYVGGSDVNNVSSTYFKTDTLQLEWPASESALLTQNLSSQEWTLATTSAYEFKINDKWAIRPGVNVMMTDYNHDFDWNQADGSLLPAQSPVGNVIAFNMEYYTHFIYQLDSFTSIRIVPELNQSLEQRNFTTDTFNEAQYNRYFFIPYMFIRSQKAHKYGFTFNIRGRLNRPRIEHVLPVVDNSNPYTTVIGNMALQNYISYNNNWSYRRILGLGKSLTFSGWTSLSIDPIGAVSTISDGNYSVSQMVNFKHRMYSEQSVEFVLPANRIKALLGIDVDFGYNRNYFIQNGNEILSLQNSLAVGPSIQFNEFDKFSFEGEYMVNFNRGSIGGVDNNPFIGHGFEFGAAFNPIDRLGWTASLDWSLFGSNSTVGAQSIPILSSGISYFIDKDKKWSIGVEAYDIFDKNQNLWRWWSGNSFVQSQSNAVTRYVMGTITYRIRRPNTNEEDD